MKRTYIKTWSVFVACVLVACSALVWVSGRLIHFEKEQEINAAKEKRRSDLRLAVWRIDSLIGPVFAEEAVRPPSHYKHYYPYDQGMLRFNNMGRDNKSSPKSSSPILTTRSEMVALNFSISPKGHWTSPQAPPFDFSNDFLGNALPPAYLGEQKAKLEFLVDRVNWEDLKERLHTALKNQEDQQYAEYPVNDNWLVQREQVELPPLENSESSQQKLSQKDKQSVEDYNARSRAINRLASQQLGQNVLMNPIDVPNMLKVSPMIPLWLSFEINGAQGLVLVRRVHENLEEYIQGVLVDWARLKTKAENEIKDLFPNAELKPRFEGSSPDPDKSLAVAPAELFTGESLVLDGGEIFTPVRVGLGLTWLALVLGALVIGAGLQKLLLLNRRRLDFVSAVTHELRTPLTTFTMYTEMLRDGMAPADRLNEYYSTLFTESRRLSHLVQNVLDYSRLESNRMVSQKSKAPFREQLAVFLPQLEELCKNRNRPFKFTSKGDLNKEATMDASALGQVLFNLVDNACKYGEGEIRFQADLTNSDLLLSVSDEGEGIAQSEQNLIFKPFYRGKTSRGKGSGVGLGLALCRRWVREMGGDLRFVRPSKFELLWRE